MSKLIYNTKLINIYIIKNDLSYSKFCKLAHISLQTLYKIFNQQKNLQLVSISKIATLMKIHIGKLFFSKI